MDCDIQPLHLDIDTLIPLGLVVNELTSNALKHTFQNRDNGYIKTTLKEHEDALHLSVQDNGQGAESISLESKSFGFSLIKSFARRLNADVEILNKNGFYASLIINTYQKVA